MKGTTEMKMITVILVQIFEKINEYRTPILMAYNNEKTFHSIKHEPFLRQ